MSDDNELEKIIAAGDSWLRELGVLTNMHHNNIIANMIAIPAVEFAEYFLDKDNKVIAITVYINVETFLIGTNKFKKLKRFLPKFLVKNEKIDTLLDVIPYSELPFIEGKKEDLLDLIRDMIREYLPNYKANIEIKRYKRGVENEET